MLIAFCSSGFSFFRHTIGFNSVYDLAYLEFTFANDEDFTAFVTLFAYDLPSLVPLPRQTQVQSVQDAPRENLEERNLLEEFTHLVNFTTVNIVEHALIILFTHHGKLAICATDYARLPCFWDMSFLGADRLLYGKLTKTFTGPDAQNRRHQLIYFPPVQSFDYLCQLYAKLKSRGNRFWDLGIDFSDGSLEGKGGVLGSFFLYLFLGQKLLEILLKLFIFIRTLL